MGKGLTSKYFSELPGHDLLLRNVTMLLYRENDRELGSDKGMVTNALDDVKESNLGGEGVAMVDDRVVVRTIPAIH